jgi:hypothetical protein
MFLKLVAAGAQHSATATAIHKKSLSKKSRKIYSNPEKSCRQTFIQLTTVVILF